MADTTQAVCTPWEVTGTIDYNYLVKQFGTELITPAIIERIEKLTGEKVHPWLTRGHFFSHRALNSFLDAYERGDPVFLYTGRGPTSDSLHLGHTIPFTFTSWLQKAFKCPVVIQMADDEKYAFKDMPFKTIYDLGFENAKDVIAFGFDPKLTFIFSNRDYRLNTDQYEVFVSDMKTKINAKEVGAIFGFNDNPSATVAMFDWPFYQSAAAFSCAFPHIFGSTKAHCLVAYAIDQDPYFRMARDIAPKMGLIKPYSIMCQFLPPLTGTDGKMSSSVGASASVFLTDDPDTIKKKIMTYAFSGGGGDGTLEDHKKFGGNPAADISYQYLRYFEYDDDELKRIYDLFKSGEMTCSEIKSILVKKATEFILGHQARRALVTPDILAHFYKKNPMVLTTRLVTVEKTDQENLLYQRLDDLKITYKTTYHKVITTMEEGSEIATRLEGAVCKNLFLRGDDDSYYILATGYDSTIDIKILTKQLGHKKLKFVESDSMIEMLKVPKGCVTVFAIMNMSEDNRKKTTVLMDNKIVDGMVNFHPLRNDATTTVHYDGVKQFVESYGVTVMLF